MGTCTKLWGGGAPTNRFRVHFMIENNVGHFTFAPEGTVYSDIFDFEQILDKGNTQQFLQAVCNSLYNNPSGTFLKIEQDGAKFELTYGQDVPEMLLNFWRYGVAIVNGMVRKGKGELELPNVLVYRPRPDAITACRRCGMPKRLGLSLPL